MNIYEVKEKTYLFDYLIKTILNKSKNNIKSLLTNKCICVNNKVVTKYNYLLKIGDVVTIKHGYINDIEIIFEDNDFIVLNKKTGLLTIATDKNKTNNLYYMVSNYVKEKNRNNKIFILHRLDKDTSGVIVFCKRQDLKETLQNNWDKLVKMRRYIGIVHGKLENSGRIVSYLKEDKNFNVFISKDHKGAKEAITNYKVSKNNSQYSLLDINIETGRKNQIRVQLNSIGHPLLGDKKYGIKDSYKRLYLHAAELEFLNPFNKKIMHFTANQPKEFKKLI